VITCERELFQNYFSLRRRPSEIILFQLVKTCPKLFQNYLTGSCTFTNVFIVTEIVFKVLLELLQRLK